MAASVDESALSPESDTPRPSNLEGARLADLRARVEAATGADRELDAAIAAALQIAAAPQFSPADGYVLTYRVSDDLRSVETWFDCGDGHPHRQTSEKPAPCTASLDAALALVERVLPGWCFALNSHYKSALLAKTPIHMASVSAKGATLPLAVLAALLSALSQSSATPERT